jgi:hypothetical protein
MPSADWGPDMEYDDAAMSQVSLLRVASASGLMLSPYGDAHGDASLQCPRHINFPGHYVLPEGLILPLTTLLFARFPLLRDTAATDARSPAYDNGHGLPAAHLNLTRDLHHCGRRAHP